MSIRIHTAIAGALTIAGAESTVIQATWKETKNQTRKERAILLQSEVFTQNAGEFGDVVQKVLRDSAEKVLKDYCNENPDSFEIPDELFTVQALCEEFLSGGGTWIGKKDLEQFFCAGDTWQRIVNREDYKLNPSIRRAAEAFKDAVLKCSGKVSIVPAKMRDAVLAKLTESELSTEWGGFIARRFAQMEAREKAESEEVTIDAL
ncbi:MAG TPA: hypothetical protein V6C65_24100 [Allocoleopsis sp.]